MSEGDGQLVLLWMNRAYEYATEGKPDKTFYCWEQAYAHADANEQRWLEKRERRQIMNEAYANSARTLVQYAQFLYEREIHASTKGAPVRIHATRREAQAKEWGETIEQAYAHALECNHSALLVCIKEAQRNPLRPLGYTLLQKAVRHFSRYFSNNR